MNQAIVMCTLCAILSGSLLENADAQTRNQPDSWSFIQSMERLSNVVENLQAKIELQETKLNNLVTKEELETTLLSNLATKTDMQIIETSVRNLDVKVAFHETSLNNVEAKLDELRQLQASMLNNLATKSDIQMLDSSLKKLEVKEEMHANSLNSFEGKLDALALLVTNLNGKQEEQVSFLSNLEGQSKLHATLINRVAAELINQTSLLHNLTSKEEWLHPVPLYATNRTIEAVQDDDVEIWCVVRGIPLPEIKWTKENGNLASNRVEYGNNGMALRIKKVALSDEGTYACVAANGVGVPVAQNFSLEVHGPTGLFAATTAGLVALDLRTFMATALTSESTLAVAVNHNLKKVYWSEGYPNSRIMRSNFDGSAKEIIVPQTGDYIFMLAIDEPSGKVYFALHNSHEIRVCDALGENRAAVISNSTLVKYPIGIALDSDNGFMYWGNHGTSPQSLVRAKLDGSNAAIISTGFIYLYGITLDQPSNDVLYWADYGENTIGTINVNGGNKRTLVKLEGNPGPYGIQVDAHKIYFSEYSSKKIQSVDKGSGKELTTIFNSTGYLYHLALFNARA